MGHVRFPCIFVVRPSDCKFWCETAREGCTADDWYLLQCFLDHYGNELKTDAKLRLVDTALHLVEDNDTELSGPGAYDLPKILQFRVRGWRR
jgi:hypothetical protein